MIVMTPETRRESAQLRKAIWDELKGHNQPRSLMR